MDGSHFECFMTCHLRHYAINDITSGLDCYAYCRNGVPVPDPIN